MSEWTKVVSQPTGLAGFGLSLVFGYLGKVKRLDERHWLSPVAVSLAAVALVGGLALAYVQTAKQPIAPIQTSNPPAVIQRTNQVQQSSSGDGSPNVQGNQGDVTITVDQSNGETKAKKKNPAAKPKEASR